MAVKVRQIPFSARFHASLRVLLSQVSPLTTAVSRIMKAEDEVYSSSSEPLLDKLRVECQ